MRRVRKSPIPPGMYRHFALVTVALTTGLAMFADGENREAMANHIEARERDNAARRASAARFGAPRLAGEPSQGQVRFADQMGDFDPLFGQPTEGPRRTRNNSSAITDLELAIAAGYSPAYLESLSPEERERLLKMLTESGMHSADVREQRSAALAAASARRSGAPTGAE